MKKHLLSMFFLVGLLSLSSISNAQILWFSPSPTATTKAVNLVVCSDTTYSIYIFNASGSTLVNPIVNVQLPAGVSYIPASIVETSATAKNVAEGTVSNLNNPSFTFDSLLANTWVSFTYRVHASCGASGNSQLIPITLNYNGGSSSPNSGSPILNTIEINKAALNIVNATNTNITTDINTTFAQTITIRNAGLGYLDGTTSNMLVQVLLDQGSCLNISNPSIGTLNGDTLVIPVSAFTTIGDNDAYWENNEDLVVSYDVTVNCCTDLSRNIQARWGCDASVCETSTALISNILIPNNTPNVTRLAALEDDDMPACFSGETVRRKLAVRNVGAGTATEVQISPMIAYSGIYPDPIPNWFWLDTNNVTISINGGTPIQVHAIPSSIVLNSTANPNYLGSVSSCWSSPNVAQRIIYFTINVPDMAPTDTVVVEFNVQALDMCCIRSTSSSACYTQAWGRMGAFGLERKFKNACGTTTYNPTAEVTSPTFIMENTAGYDGPTDVQNNEAFNLQIKTNGSRIRNSNEGGTSYTVMTLNIDLPADITLNGPPVINNLDLEQMVVRSLTQVGSSISIEFEPIISANVNQGFFENTIIEIPLLGACGTGGLKSVKYGWDVILDTTCATSCPIPFGCDEYQVALHCPGCTDNGLVNTGFDMDRLNYGLPDNNYDGLPDATGTLDFNKIDLKRVVGGDTVSAIAQGKMLMNAASLPAPASFGYSYAEISFPAAIDQFFIPLPATMYLYRGGNVLHTCTNIVPSAITSSVTGLPGYKYDWNTCLNGFSYTYTNNDSIVLDGKFVIASTLGAGIVPGGSDYIAVPQSLMYAATSANPTDTANYWYCDKYSNYVKITEMTPSTNFGANNVGISGCEDSYRQAARIDLNVGTGTGPSAGQFNFPYEYRQLSYPVTFTEKLPAGFSYTPGSAIVTVQRASGIGSTNTNYPITPIINGNELVFDLAALYNVNSGPAVIGSEGYYHTIQFKMTPDCGTPSGAYRDSALVASRFVTAENQTYWVNGSGNIISNQQTVNNTHTYNYQAPGPNIQGGGTQLIYNDSVSWNVVLENLQNIQAPNSWFYLSTVQGTPLSNVEIKQGTTVITPNANGFYQLGSNLGGSSGVNYTVSGLTQSCDTTQIELRMGWGCNGYPTSIDSTTCTYSVPLVAVPYPVGTDASFNVFYTAANSTVNFCDTFEVELIMNATQLGDLRNLKNTWTLPGGFGADLANIQIQYPAGTGYRTPSNLANAAFSGNSLTVDYSLLDSATANGIKGSYSIPGKELRLKVPFYSECGAVSGDAIKVFYDAKAACGDSIPTIVKESVPIKFAEATVLGYLTSPSGSMDAINSCSPSAIYTYHASIPIISAPGSSLAGDSIMIELPPTMDFVAYNATASGQSNQPMVGPFGPVVLGSGNLRYSWPMTAGLNTGDTIKFDYTFTFNNDLYNGCGSVNEAVKLTTGSITPVVCNAVNCNIVSVNGLAEQSLTVNLPTVTASIPGTPSSIFDAATSTHDVITDVVLTNSSSVAINIGDTSTVEFYCDNNANGLLDAGDTYFDMVQTTAGVPANGSTTISNVNLTYACSNNMLAIFRRNPSPNGPVQCACSNTQSQFTQVITGFLPVDIISFEAQALDQNINELRWEVVSEQNLSHYQIERSQDGVSFDKIGIQTAIGRNNQKVNYQYLDASPALISYYRLKVIDQDDQFKYSNIVSIVRNKKGELGAFVFPNPTKNELQFIYNAESTTSLKIEVLDMSGRVLMKEVGLFDGNTKKINLVVSKLAAANYIIRYRNLDTQEVNYIKFSKQ